MAEPLARRGAVEMLEDGVHLLRQAPPGTLLCYWTGSVPLALAALRFWNDVTNPRASGLLCLLESLALALLLIWMNCWRAVFAGRLRRQLSGSAEAPWTGARIGQLIAVQAFLGASKLMVLPCALLIGFPWAPVIAFYRDAAALSDRGLAPAEVIRRARRLARRNQGQTWSLTALLLLLGFFVMFNVFLALALLPQLVRMLTGYESVFSRGGPYFLANGMFAAVVLAITWLAFDPYAQAVFSVRGFRAESVETGEDLRAGLRRIRTVAAALLLIFALLPHASAAVSTQELRKASREAIEHHEYDWRLPPPSSASAGKPWLVEFTDRATAGVRKALDFIGDLIGRFFRWLNDRLSSRLAPGEGPPPALGLHWTIATLAALSIFAAAWLVWRRRRARRPGSKPAITVAIHLDAEDIVADRLPEEEWLAMAERCLAGGNLRTALRALYLANLAWLGGREWIAIHPGKTNHEYETELRRRARAVPGARDLFAANVRAFERVWYGTHEATAEEIDRFRRRSAEMKAMGAAA
jgi:hypothetical protein